MTKFKDDFNLTDFKDGVAYALLSGTRNEEAKSLEYKEGYDFGITMYCELESNSI